MNQAAFPSPGVVLKSKFDGDPYQQGAYEGMTLRDYFAAKAMAALLSRTDCTYTAEGAAGNAYLFADAMLKAREA